MLVERKAMSQEAQVGRQWACVRGCVVTRAARASSWALLRDFFDCLSLYRLTIPVQAAGRRGSTRNSAQLVAGQPIAATVVAAQSEAAQSVAARQSQHSLMQRSMVYKARSAAVQSLQRSQLQTSHSKCTPPQNKRLQHS